MLHLQSYRRDGPSSPDKLPAIVLVKDGWNDFGYRTLFSAYLFTTKTSDPVSLGMVKILERGKISTDLPKYTPKLSDAFCSLGQTSSYYDSLLELREPLRLRILKALRDVCHAPAVAESFKDDEGFRISLLRESEAAAMYERARTGEPPDTANLPSFRFTSHLPGASTPHSIDFDFSRAPLVPNRVFAIIGKNGSGKTQYLRRLADSASGTDVDDPKGTFEPSRPGFSTVVAVSYSAFDDFTAESARTAKGYAYCGLYGPKGRPKTRRELWRDTRADLKEIMQQGREATWRDAIAALFDDDRASGFKLANDDEGKSLKAVRETSATLSAGELFLLAMMSRIIGFVRPTSLIILDEPEMHLHPNAIGKLVHAIRLVATRFQSQVILATHSPIVLQQIPARYVRVLRRTLAGPEVSLLQEESFGQNLTALTESIFHSADEPPVFATWLRQQTESHPPEVIEAAFPLGLSFTARSYIQSLARPQR